MCLTKMHIKSLIKIIKIFFKKQKIERENLRPKERENLRPKKTIAKRAK